MSNRDRIYKTISEGVSTNVSTGASTALNTFRGGVDGSRRPSAHMTAIAQMVSGMVIERPSGTSIALPGQMDKTLLSTQVHQTSSVSLSVCVVCVCLSVCLSVSTLLSMQSISL